MTTLRFYRKGNTSDASDIVIQVIFIRRLETDHKNDINSSLFEVAASDCYHECIIDEFRCKSNLPDLIDNCSNLFSVFYFVY